MGEFEPLLLHQESKSRIEVIKLTGRGRAMRNGATSITAENIQKAKKRSSDSDGEWKWDKVPVVHAKVQGAQWADGESTVGVLTCLEYEGNRFPFWLMLLMSSLPPRHRIGLG